jgi:hypothetical protein
MTRHGWKKPREEFVKLNMDAGFNINFGTGSTGAILRDDRGHFLAASSGNLPFVSDAATAEVWKDYYWLVRLEVNSDCMEVVKIMQNGGNSLGPTVTIYEECTFLCRNFTEVVFDHRPREANVTAHCLAGLEMEWILCQCGMKNLQISFFIF